MSDFPSMSMKPHATYWNDPAIWPVERDLPQEARDELSRERMVDNIRAKTGSPDNRIDGIRVTYTHEGSDAQLIVMGEDDNYSPDGSR